jgi:hypothetical protein
MLAKEGKPKFAMIDGGGPPGTSGNVTANALSRVIGDRMDRRVTIHTSSRPTSRLPHLATGLPALAVTASATDCSVLSL